VKPDAFSRAIAWAIRRRAILIIAYALLVPLAAYRATHIPTHVGIDRLIVPTDPDYAATRAYERVFPESQLVLLVFESPDPWAPASLARVEHAKAALAQIPHVTAFSAIDALRRARPNATPSVLRGLATGTSFFRRQGLVGERYMTLLVNLDVRDPSARDAALAAIDRAVPDPSVHRVGSPYVNAWLERQASAATTRSFIVFGILLLAITLFLYSSVRALLAITLTLGATVALALAAGALLGFTFTVVSALVPLTVMVTTLATLTYLHSRFVDQPVDVPLEVHHVAALRSKLLPVTASTIAAATGFAALAISRIEPIRELGIWTAVGLSISWVVAYTLFPALQSALRTPTMQRVRTRTVAYDHLAAHLPLFTYRHRLPILAITLALAICGALAITGVPGAFAPLPLQVDGIGNVDHATRIYRDARWFQSHVMDLNVAHIWIHLPDGTATDPETLRAIDAFHKQLDATTNVTGVTGPTTPLRMRSYLSGHGDQLPSEPGAFADATADVEQLILTQPDFRPFINPNLTDVQLTLLFSHGNYAELANRIDQAWAAVSPALAGATMHVVGQSLLQAKVGANLVPTLAESFILTIILIMLVFLVVFRSGLERLLAMIPSLFALLVTFLGLRLLGGSLNVATIIIATTVLGTTENDQMHFFHHMHEVATSPLEARLRHTLRISGRAVLFATIINAVGFLGLATSSFPPLRQFGIMTAAAFVLALVADFLALPAALWFASGERPTSVAAEDPPIPHKYAGAAFTNPRNGRR
jgi:predicted RND superfamily exporter protein